jgi:hypothetical protein
MPPLFMITPRQDEERDREEGEGVDAAEHLLRGGEHRVVESDGDDRGDDGGDADADGDRDAEGEQEEDPDEQDEADEGGDVHDDS